MKYLALVLTMFATLTAVADSYQVVKVSDGTTAYCKTKSDYFRYHFQAYSLKAIELNRESNNQINLSFNVSMKSCQKLEDHYSFIEVNPMDNFSYDVFYDLDANGEALFNHVIAETVELKGLVYVDGVYKTLFHNDATGNVRMQLSLSELLGADRIAALDNGELVKANFDFHLQRKLNLYSELATDGKPHKHFVNYGGYRFKLELKNVKGEIRIKILK